MGLFLNSLWVMESSFPLKSTPFRSGKLSSFSQNGAEVWLPWTLHWSSLFCLWRTSPPLYSQNPEGFNRSAAPVQSFPPWEEDVFIRQLLCSKLMHFHHFTLITTQRDVWLLSPCYRWENWGSKKLSDLLEVRLQTSHLFRCTRLNLVSFHFTSAKDTVLSLFCMLKARGQSPAHRAKNKKVSIEHTASNESELRWALRPPDAEEWRGLNMTIILLSSPVCLSRSR